MRTPDLRPLLEFNSIDQAQPSTSPKLLSTQVLILPCGCFRYKYTAALTLNAQLIHPHALPSLPHCHLHPAFPLVHSNSLPPLVIAHHSTKRTRRPAPPHVATSAPSAAICTHSSRLSPPWHMPLHRPTIHVPPPHIAPLLPIPHGNLNLFLRKQRKGVKASEDRPYAHPRFTFFWPSFKGRCGAR